VETREKVGAGRLRVIKHRRPLKSFYMRVLRACTRVHARAVTRVILARHEAGGLFASALDELLK